MLTDEQVDQYLEFIKDQMTKINTVGMERIKATEDKQIANGIMASMIDHKFASNTVLNIFKKQVENARQNALIESVPLEDLIGLAENDNALCIAFGYSVGEYVNELKMYSERAKNITIVADRGVKWLNYRGVQIDYIVCMDAHISAEYLGEGNFEHTHMIAHIGASHDYIKKFVDQGGTVTFINTRCRFNSDYLLNEIKAFTHHVYVGGNVGNAGVVVASDILKCKDIYLFGYDFAWRDGQYYPDTSYSPSRDDGSDMTIREIIPRDGIRAYTNIQFDQYRKSLKILIDAMFIEKQLFVIGNISMLELGERIGKTELNKKLI